MWQFRAASRELMLAAALRWSTAAQHFFGAKRAKKTRSIPEVPRASDEWPI
jgi:hypothetical protein